MAKSFYGYVKRDDKAFVDWGAIGTQLSDDLALESKRRADKRQEIELQTIEDVKEINKLGADQSQLNSEFYMDAADQIREFLLMSQGEMQKGGWSGLRPSEFLKQRQVINDGVDQLATAAESQAAQQAELLKRVQANEAGLTERYNHEDLDQFISTENKSVYINPINGRMSIATRDPITKKISTDPKNLLDINRLSTRMTYRANTPDIDSMVSKANKVLSPTTIALTQGGIKSIKTAMNNPKYLDAETSMIKGMMASDEVIANILGLDPEYDMTEDATEADKSENKRILTKKDENGVFVPILSESQKTEAEEILRARIRASLEKVQTGREESSADRQYNRGLALKKEKRVGYIRELEKIYSGGQVDVESAIGSIVGRLGKDAPRVKVTEDEILLTYPDGSTDQIPKDGTFQDFAIAAGTKLLPSDVDDITIAYDDWKASGEKANPRSSIETGTLGRKGAGVPLASIEIEVGDETKTPKEYIDDTKGSQMDKAVEKVLVGSLPEEYKNKLKVSVNKTKFFNIPTGGILQISLPGVIENLKFEVPSDRGEVYKLVELIKSAAEDGRQISIEEIAKVYKDPKDQSNLREINEVKLKKTPISQ